MNFRRLITLFVLLLPLVLRAQFTFVTNSGTITVTGYTGPISDMVIPSTINGYPVTGIAPWAFWGGPQTRVTFPDSLTYLGNDAFLGCGALTNVILGNSLETIGESAFSASGLTSVVIPRSVWGIGESAFNTGALKAIYFQGNAPHVGVFYTYSLGPESVPLYYLPGTTGWTSFDPAASYRNHPIVLWNPRADSNGVMFGVRSNRFGFSITGTPGIPIVV